MGCNAKTAVLGTYIYKKQQTQNLFMESGVLHIEAEISQSNTTQASNSPQNVAIFNMNGPVPVYHSWPERVAVTQASHSIIVIATVWWHVTEAFMTMLKQCACERIIQSLDMNKVRPLGNYVPRNALGTYTAAAFHQFA